MEGSWTEEGGGRRDSRKTGGPLLIITPDYQDANAISARTRAERNKRLSDYAPGPPPFSVYNKDHSSLRDLQPAAFSGRPCNVARHMSGERGQ